MRRRPYRAGRDPVTVRLPAPENGALVPKIEVGPHRKETAVSEYQASEETAAVEETTFAEDEQEQTAPVAESDSQDDWNDD